MGKVFNFFDKLKKVLNKTGSVFWKIVWPIMFIAFLGLLLVALLFVCPGGVLIIPFLCIGVFLSFVWKKYIRPIWEDYICPIWKVNGECPNCKKSLSPKNLRKLVMIIMNIIKLRQFIHSDVKIVDTYCWTTG